MNISSGRVTFEVGRGALAFTNISLTSIDPNDNVCETERILLSVDGITPDKYRPSSPIVASVAEFGLLCVSV